METEISQIRESHNLSYEEGMFTKFADQVYTGDHYDQRYRDHEEFDAIVREYRREIGGLESVIGSSHTITNELRFYLSVLLSNHGHWKDAEELAKEVLETFRETLGTEHPNALLISSHLSSIYQRQGRWTEAESLQAPVLKLQQKVLGSHHPQTISTMQQLAMTFAELGRWKVAEQLQEDVCKLM